MERIKTNLKRFKDNIVKFVKAPIQSVLDDKFFNSEHLGLKISSWMLAVTGIVSLVVYIILFVKRCAYLTYQALFISIMAIFAWNFFRRTPEIRAAIYTLGLEVQCYVSLGYWISDYPGGTPSIETIWVHGINYLMMLIACLWHADIYRPDLLPWSGGAFIIWGQLWICLYYFCGMSWGTEAVDPGIMYRNSNPKDMEGVAKMIGWSTMAVCVIKVIHKIILGFIWPALRVQLQLMCTYGEANPRALTVKRCMVGLKSKLNSVTELRKKFEKKMNVPDLVGQIDQNQSRHGPVNVSRGATEVHESTRASETSKAASEPLKQKSAEPVFAD